MSTFSSSKEEEASLKKTKLDRLHLVWDLKSKPKKQLIKKIEETPGRWDWGYNIGRSAAEEVDVDFYLRLKQEEEGKKNIFFNHKNLS